MVRTAWEQYIIPRTRLAILLDSLIELHKSYPKEPFTRSEFVLTLHLSLSSGGPDHKLISLRQFGLIDRDVTQTKYIITDLGRTIVSSDGSERVVSIEKAIKKVAIWDHLLKTVGTVVTDDKFIPAFKSFTGASDNEIEENIAWLKSAYTSDIACINRTPPFSEWTARVSKRQKRSHGSNAPLNKAPRKEHIINFPQDLTHFAIKEKLTVEYGSFKFEVKDESTFMMAMLLLLARKNELVRQGLTSEIVVTVQKGDPTMGT